MMVPYTNNLNGWDMIKAVYATLLGNVMSYVPTLLSAVSQLFLSEFNTSLVFNRIHHKPHASTMVNAIDFQSKYQRVLEQVVVDDQKKRRLIPQQGASSFNETKKGQALLKQKEIQKKNEEVNLITPKRLTKAEKAAEKRHAKRKAMVSGDPKKGRVWENQPMDVAQVDKSDHHDQQDDNITIACVDDMQFEDDDDDIHDIHDDHVEEEKNGQLKSTLTQAQPTSAFQGLYQFMHQMTHKPLTELHLKPMMSDMNAHLVSKNVAADIADKLCNSVYQSLLGKTHTHFTSVVNTVKSTMTKTLTQLLTPKRHIDIGREIQSARDASRPYTIVFVGVNGVGKSTSLAKVCAWLLKQKHQVMIAACDTFRSGAVEQLKVHAKALGNIPVFDQGYGKDAAHIAQQAIAKATTDGMDVVLIDTAGRMQDNEPLMAALAKLVKINQPDLILFVGEALVGNDAVDQLSKFNRAFEEYGDIKHPRSIDGIVLTKFDTVDDKVGAAISMVYTTGQPIVFVGVGQTYADLRTLNVSKIVNILVSGRS